MADNNLENVRVLVRGNQYSISQLGIDLIQQMDVENPIVEAVVVSRRASGLIEAETSLLRNDTLAKLAEHLTLRSNFESAQDNAMIAYEECAERGDPDEE